MRFAGGQEPALQRKVIREVEVGGADTAREGAAKGSLQPAGAKGQQRFRIGEEEAGGEFVLAAPKFAIPVRGELVVRVFSRPADAERSCSAARAGDRGAENASGGARDSGAFQRHRVAARSSAVPGACR